MRETLELIKKAVDASTDFEKQNSELKRQYIVSNIMVYNLISSFIKESKGTFGTGYPFYALNSDLTGALPIIDEQLRYNDELAQEVMKDYEKNKQYREWRCATCLRENGSIMPDLKQICKTCPQVADAFKPRKVINRLPDIDMWTICNPNEIEIVSQQLQSGLANFGFTTSDVDPIKTIYDLIEIVQSLKSDKMPKKYLPIDTHIIDNVTLYTLICKIPDVLDYCFRHDEVPYLPIHPLSLRKTWQKDDCAYNFVWDYLQSLTDFNIDTKIKEVLDQTRMEVAKKYSLKQLEEFLLKAAPDSGRRRHQTPELQEYFKKRIESWKEPDEPTK